MLPSHRTQRLDLGAFGPLKRVMASKLEPLLHVEFTDLIASSISLIENKEEGISLLEMHKERRLISAWEL